MKNIIGERQIDHTLSPETYKDLATESEIARLKQYLDQRDTIGALRMFDQKNFPQDIGHSPEVVHSLQEIWKSILLQGRGSMIFLGLLDKLGLSQKDLVSPDIQEATKKGLPGYLQNGYWDSARTLLQDTGTSIYDLDQKVVIESFLKGFKVISCWGRGLEEIVYLTKLFNIPDDVIRSIEFQEKLKQKLPEIFIGGVLKIEDWLEPINALAISKDTLRTPMVKESIIKGLTKSLAIKWMNDVRKLSTIARDVLGITEEDIVTIERKSKTFFEETDEYLP